MLMKEIELQKWGNSQGFRLSKDELKELNATEETVKFQMIIENGQITLIPKRPQPNTLEELFSTYNGGDLTETEYTWGDPVGEEII